MESLNVVNLTDYILLPREQRTAHVDLTDPCECFPYSKQNNRKVFRRLLNMLGVENDINNRMKAGVDVCHLCDNPFCSNPLHTYFGTRSENRADIPKSVRRESSLKQWEGLTPEERSETARKRLEAMTSEKREEMYRRQGESMRNSWEAKTPSEREEFSRKVSANSPIKRGVQLIDFNGDVYIFESLTHAADVLGLDSSSLSALCYGKRKTHKGFTASFWEG